MQTIGFIASKGGVGKSTLAAHVAVSASLSGKTVAAIDLDPQRSLFEWGRRRTIDDIVVTDARVQEVPGMLAKARAQGADLVVIDSAGRNDTSAAQLAALADLILVPLRPGVYDLEAVAKTAAMLRGAKALGKSFGLLNACQPRGSRAMESRIALEAIGLQMCPLYIGQLVDFCDALTDGRSVFELNPRGKAAFEIKGLFRWISEL